MRILLMHHFPLAQSEVGRLVRHWALSLEEAGHEVRLLVIDDHSIDAELPQVEHVVCREDDITADLSFAVPRFSGSDVARSRLTFAALSDQQLADYRDRLRRRLDAIIDGFDPDVLHAQHIWVLGQLGLETGVPYVLNAWGTELADYGLDRRYRSLADQAAENAGRILVPDDDLLRRVASLFEGVGERTLVMPPEVMLSTRSHSPAERRVAGDRLLTVYQAALDERFGAHC